MDERTFMAEILKVPPWPARLLTTALKKRSQGPSATRGEESARADSRDSAEPGRFSRRVA
jgi:hypothetical protein